MASQINFLFSTPRPRWLLVCGTIALLTLLGSASATENVTQSECVVKSESCSASKDGLILPCWRPYQTTTPDLIARGAVYFFALCYMFLGVSIVSDRFMSAIEMITSQEKQVTVTRPNGEKAIVSVQIWNETVSNLTLMALGSSAPEIMLSVIEIMSRKFVAGDLGPGTIVGSAAFNLFVIISICVYVIPDDEGRRIEHLRVFICTASWSVFAYIWLYLIIAVFSPNEVTVFEAVLTFAFFPLLVIIAYITDRKIFFMKFLEKKYTAHYVGAQEDGNDSRNGDVEMQKHGQMNNHEGSLMNNETVGFKGSKANLADFSASEQHKRDFMKRLAELREQHPDLDADKLEQMAAYEVVQSQHKSRAYYRIAATRKMTGGGNVLKRNIEKKVHDKEISVIEEEEDYVKVLFDPDHYTVMENVGSFEVTVSRVGEKLDFYTYVDFETIDGTANQGSDFHYATGTLVFKPEETSKEITLHIVDDDLFEEDEHFSVKLSNLRNSKSPGDIHKTRNDPSIDCRLGASDEVVITILDDDHCGVFCFEEEEISCPENCGEVKIKVARHSGARGNIHVPFLTIDGSAKGGGVDYEDSFGELNFVNDETFKIISVKVVDDEEYQKSEHFYVEIGTPRQVARRTSNGSVVYEDENTKEESEMTEDELIAIQGRPKLGAITRCKVVITESKEFTSAVDRLMKNTNMGELLSTSSWTEQFIEAITVSAGGDDDDEENEDEEGGGEEQLPSCMDYAMHFLTVFWKLLFAFIPPTNIMGGWACFVVSIFGIGALTAVIGDLASHFGCTVGLKDAVTAISFVALGTSIPDTFASKTAACGDKTADASIGNVTGSNAVNVFLGIGIAWSVAAIYHAIQGTPGGFKVEPGALGFSVTVFCILASICIFTLLFRRVNKNIAYELGGPKIAKTITSLLFLGLWITYVLLSALVAYCVFDPGF